MKQLLSNIFIEPLMQIHGAVYAFVPGNFGEGGRIILFSVLLNLMLIPVYAQMERKAQRGRALRERVAAEVARMKRHFKGRELYYYVRAVHRQFGYRPISHLLGSADLAVQILVFATVYQFLSGLEGLQGTSFGPLKDLSAPDRLLAGVNALPLLMTAINAATVFAYVGDKARRIQALALAVLFLVLLYSSPSSLVLYWTANNMFSLARLQIQKHWASRPAAPWKGQLAELRQQQ